MQGIFIALQNPVFYTIKTTGGHMIALENQTLLTVRGSDHIFKTHDAVVSYVYRHFVSAEQKSAKVETPVSVE